jgi:hypothetical protein
MSSFDFNDNNKLSEIKERYLDFNKKQYYLASVDENVDMLQKKQINDLTNFLIGLKSEYDNLILERRKIEKERDNLEKQIDSINTMDNKTKKKSEEANFMNDNIKEAINENQKKLKEELYNKKTLNAMIEKLKIDIEGKIKEMNKYEGNQIKLKLKLQREKLNENEIREKNNQIYNKITEQKKKNNFSKNEYDLKLGYYKTIINQKWMFINSSNERYKRQKKIAHDAKNSINDKEEINKRHSLHLLYLLDNYLNKKMEKQLNQNIELEDAFRKIKLYSGTSNLKLMVDKIIQKDKYFNYTISRVINKEKEKKFLEERINELNIQLNQLKTSLVIKENENNNKEVKAIKTFDIENKNSNLNLLKEEKELNRKYIENQKIYSNVSLKYDQVINNIKKLCEKNTLLNSEENSNINLISDNSNQQSINNTANIDLNNEDNIINLYNDYLIESEKTIDILFLCHNKNKFINMLKEKEIEESLKNNKKIKNKLSDKIPKFNNSEKNLKNKKYSEMEEMEFINEDKEEKIQQQIFNQYMNTQRRKVELYIKNEREKR